MTCAMHLHDPCDGGEVQAHRIIVTGYRDCRVPMCWKHVRAWDGDLVPFKRMTQKEREKWARWAADRARRQNQKQETTT